MEKTPRISIPKAVRQYVFERDGHHCQMCYSAKSLTIDHIVPLALGGTNDISNLRTLCHSCNARKGNRLSPDTRRYFT